MTECCRCAFARHDHPPLGDLSATVDWPLFLRVVRFHRVQGLVWTCLRQFRASVPQPQAEMLAADSAGIASANLWAAAESRGLLTDFEHAGIPLLFVKGLTLGVLAYGNASMKAAVDIDLLVRPGDLGEASRLLEHRGYALQAPRGRRAAEHLPAWHGPRKESLWARSDPRSVIDLHTRLSDNPLLIPSLGIDSPRQLVEVAKGISLPTLRLDDLFAYLCVHGASSAWFRFKWVTDVAALLHGRTAAEIEQLYCHSQQVGAGRAAAQALLLTDAFYGALQGNPRLQRDLIADPVNRSLFRAALGQIIRREPREPTARPWGTLTIHWTQLLLLPGWRFKLSEIIRQARAALG